jgi:hypothetical protein
MDTGRRETDHQEIHPGHVLVMHHGIRRAEDAFRPMGDLALKGFDAAHCPYELSQPMTSPSTAEDRAYQDRKYPGRWLAGLAAVGNTGYVVIVQQRDVEGNDPVLWGGVTVLLLTLLTAAVAFAVRWRSRRAGPGSTAPR